MRDELKVLERIAPDLIRDIGRRAQILVCIEGMQPVGRRALAARLSLPEREVRAAAAALKEQGLISMDAAGMQLTGAARETLPVARDLSRVLFGLTDLEQTVARVLKIGRVVVVPGNADEEPRVLEDAGRAAAQRVLKLLQKGMTLAVTGGGTMSQVAQGMHTPQPMDVMVVPARGGMGSREETQANAVAAEIARRIGGHHRVIHLPDNLDAAALQELLRLPEIQESLSRLRGADVVVHGVGRADVMAEKRRVPPEGLERIRKKRAVGEAFGDFFDFEGRTVYQAGTLSAAGLGFSHQNARMVMVAAGEGKAEAIIAAARHEQHDSLITDEAAARKISALLAR